MSEIHYMVPVVTALRDDGTLDMEGNEYIYDHLAGTGIDGIVLLGSTGEFFSLTGQQKRELIDLASVTIGKRSRLIVGTGGMDVKETLELTEYAMARGADAVMVISPYYFPLNGKSLECFYDCVAAETKVPVYLYNFPARTGYDLDLSVIKNLLHRHKNIIGIKDSVNSMEHTRRLIVETHAEFPEFEVYSGMDDNFLHTVLSGGNGAIGALANLCPELVLEYSRSVQESNMTASARLQQKIDRFMHLYEIGIPFIPTMKYAMKLRGMPIGTQCTFPFQPLSVKEKEEIQHLLSREGLLENRR